MTIDAQTVIGAVTQDICHKRRMEIKPVLNKEFSGICNLPIASGEWLFGENVTEQLKNSRATANVIRSTVRPFRSNFRFTPYSPRGNFQSNLNWRGPPQHLRGGFNQSFRGRSFNQAFRRGTTRFPFQRNN